MGVLKDCLLKKHLKLQLTCRTLERENKKLRKRVEYLEKLYKLGSRSSRIKNAISDPK